MEGPIKITRIGRNRFYEDLLARDKEKPGLARGPQMPLSRLSKYLRKRTVMPADAPVPDCVACGACCAYLLFVPVTVRDCARLSEFVEITLDESDASPGVDRVLGRQPENGYCVHLTGEVGSGRGCSIYATRPNVCREFEAGSDRCHEYRRIYGLELPLSEVEAAAALKRLDAAEQIERIADVRILESATVTSFSFSFDQPDSGRCEESVRLKVVAYDARGEPHELHSFDPAKETWLESDFLSLTMIEAAELIAARSGKELI